MHRKTFRFPYYNRYRFHISTPWIRCIFADEMMERSRTIERRYWKQQCGDSAPRWRRADQDDDDERRELFAALDKIHGKDDVGLWHDEPDDEPTILTGEMEF